MLDSSNNHKDYNINNLILRKKNHIYIKTYAKLSINGKSRKQAGAELGQAQFKLRLDFN